MYFSCFRDSQVERYLIQFSWYWLSCSMPSNTVTRTPRAPVTYTARGMLEAARNGMIAAEAISEIFRRLYQRMQEILFRSYQLIWSSRRSMIGSGAKAVTVALMGAQFNAYQ